MFLENIRDRLGGHLVDRETRDQYERYAQDRTRTILDHYRRTGEPPIIPVNNGDSMRIEDLTEGNRKTKAECVKLLIENRTTVEASMLAKYGKPADEDATGPTLIMIMLDALRTRHES